MEALLKGEYYNDDTYRVSLAYPLCEDDDPYQLMDLKENAEVARYSLYDDSYLDIVGTGKKITVNLEYSEEILKYVPASFEVKLSGTHRGRPQLDSCANIKSDAQTSVGWYLRENGRRAIV